MRSGRMPLASGWSVNDNFLNSLRWTLENMPFTRLSDGRLDGKGATEYEHDLSRGDLSRPACSHVKQVAKQAGDTCDPGLLEFFPGRFFCDHFQGWSRWRS